MQTYPYHVFVCEQQKTEGVPCCSARGSAAVIEALRGEIARQKLLETVQVTVCGSIGLCERGPNMVVYPEGVWYSGVQPTDVAEIVTSHFGRGEPVKRLMNTDAGALRVEIAGNRTRAMNAMRERDASGALPEPLFQTIRGFQESRVVLTAIELDIFSAVGSGATAAAVAGRIAAHPRSTEMLLNALTSMALLTKRDGIFANTPATSRYLAAGGKDDSRAGLMHIANLWQTWSHLTASVRAGTSAESEVTGRGDQWTEAFIAAMHRNATERAPLIVRAVGPDGARRMLDVGGGSAAYSIAFVGAHPELHSEVFDLPTVTPIAQRHITAAGLEDRITTRNGDLRTDNFGSGYDLVFVSAICHMLSPAENQDLVKRCYAALTTGGRLVVQDFILEPDKTSPRSAALFALNMLVGTEGGSSYSEAEYAAWLEAAGFTPVRRIRLPGTTNLMLGIKP